MTSKFFRGAGVTIFLTGTLVWFLGGARAGFSNDKIAIVSTHALTGIEKTEYVDGFQPGFEFIALGFLGLAGLFAVAAVRERKASSTRTTQHTENI